MNQSRLRWWLLALVLFAFLLRTWNLGGKSLWVDEAFALWNAERTPAEIWAETHDNHPPLYYLLLHQWIAFSRHESWLRLPSVFASMLSLALTFALSRRLFGKQTAVTAAALLAAAPLSIWYAQEARMVIFVAPAALLIALGLAHGSWAGGLLLFIGLAAGLYFDYTIIPLWVILSGLWLENWSQNGRPRPQLAIWLTGSLAGWLAYLPLWSHLGLVIGRLGSIFIFANIRDQLGLPDLGGPVFLAALLTLGLAASLTGRLWRKLAQRPALYHPATLIILAAFILLTLLTPLPRLYSLKRVIVTGWPLVIILVALLLSRPAPLYRRLRTGVLALSLTAACISLWLIPKDDWRAAVTYINQHITPGDVVWLAPSSGQIPYNYYQPQVPPMVGRDLIDNPPVAEIWHIAERQPGIPIPNGLIESWLNENRPLLETIPLYRLEVRHYGVPDPPQP